MQLGLQVWIFMLRTENQTAENKEQNWPANLYLSETSPTEETAMSLAL